MKTTPLLILGLLFLQLGCTGESSQTAPTPVASSASPQRTPTANITPAPPPPVKSTAATEVTSEVRKIVADTLGLKPDDVGADTPLSKLKKPADELDVVEIIMRVEERFDIEIRDDELAGSDISTVTNITPRQIADLVERRRNIKQK